MYLLEEGEETQKLRENVCELLASQTHENIALALQLITGGGMHASFVFPLWATFYNLPTAAKRKAKKLLKQFIADDVLDLHTFSFYDILPKKIIDLQEEMGRQDAVNFGVEAFLRWIFPEASGVISLFDYYYQRYPAFRLELLKTKINFDSQLDFSYSKLTCLPAEIVELSKTHKITVIIINYSAITEVPESFFELQKLRYFHHTNTPLANNKALLKQIYKQMPMLKATEIFDKAMTNYYNQKYESAAKKLKNVVKLVTNHFEFWQWYGETHRMAEQKEDAMAGFEKAFEMKPNSGSVWSKLAELRCNFKMYDEALDMCETFIQNPQRFESNDIVESDIYFVKGLALFWKEQYDESILAYQTANTLNEYAGTWYNLACSYSKKHNKKEMLKHLKEALLQDWEGYYMFCLEDEDRDFEDYYEDRDFQRLLEDFKR